MNCLFTLSGPSRVYSTFHKCINYLSIPQQCTFLLIFLFMPFFFFSIFRSSLGPGLIHSLRGRLRHQRRGTCHHQLQALAPADENRWVSPTAFVYGNHKPVKCLLIVMYRCTHRQARATSGQSLTMCTNYAAALRLCYLITIAMTSDHQYLIRETRQTKSGGHVKLLHF